ncbi:MAG TPA: AAA-like domain-containing protein [Candidatus Kapabacteria bacterium]|nr:AAA-like domain-containing protein [Candidatus Kapabacteria bacterium]
MINQSRKEFNDAGLCVPHLHYMADRSTKIAGMIKLVEKGKYFTINRPRQYGKTTLYLMEIELEKMGYLVFDISFEGVSDSIFASEELFVPAFLEMLQEKFKQTDHPLSHYLLQQIETTTSLKALSKVITEITATDQKIVLEIDEVDKSTNNQLFLVFLGMLRAKYLLRNKGKDSTFFSVILAGVHDVKNLKRKIRRGDEQQYNSPWNIAVNFPGDLSLSTDEIESLLHDFLTENNIRMNTGETAEKLYYLTSGYPFLVSRLCKIIVEEIKPVERWELIDIDTAVNILLKEDNTNFQSLITNLENNQPLYNMVYRIVLDGENIGYNLDNPIIEQGVTHGVFRDDNGRVRIHNRVYEQRIYNYMASKVETSSNLGHYNFREHFLEKSGELNVKEVLLRFQTFLKEQYSEKDLEFLERNGRLLFMTFLRPIINGKGFDFKEVEISEEKRLDIVVTYGSQKYIIELKKWYGEEAHQKGLNQLMDYLDRQNQNLGFLIIYDSRRKSNKIGENEMVNIGSKQIFMVWV